MSASNIHDNIFQLFTGERSYRMAPKSAEEKFLDRLKSFDDISDKIKVSDMLWNAIDMPYHITGADLESAKAAIAEAIIKNDPLALGKVIMYYAAPALLNSIEKEGKQ